MKYEFNFSRLEIEHLVIAAVAIAFAFSMILFRGEIIKAFMSGRVADVLLFFVLSLIIVGLAFILHEMGHKFAAQKKGLWAEFRMWPMGLLIAVVTSIFGFIFAAPGAVMILPAKKTRYGFALTHVSPKDMGQIGSAGPIVNIILAGVFIILASISPFVVSSTNIWFIAAQINAWLAIFNLIPFGLLDGYKVFKWNPLIWGGLMGLSVLMFALTIII